ncbi:GtrA family protein [Tropicimonas sp.]|uniref:GtrA family protein n=1 Tax=Tropicimonas sp. TaxID=2067044 RepID=UPI003A89709C
MGTRPSGLGRLGRYGAVGILTNVTLYLLFLLLVRLGLPPVPVSGLCYLLGVTMSYLLNRRWTFVSQASHRQDLPRFLAAYGVGLAVTLLSMTVLLIWTGPALAQFLTIGISAAAIYATLHVLKFGQT